MRKGIGDVPDWLLRPVRQLPGALTASAIRFPGRSRHAAGTSGQL
jgi:hypothetical protein